MRFNRLDLNLLVALDALLTERSVTRAAARLNLSASATSDALGRLREYFDDALLLQVGRRMEPTPRAEALQHVVRDLLVRVDSAIASPLRFDPATSDRSFRIFVSDYTQLVLGPHLMAAAAAQGCRAKLEFLPQVADPQHSLERGEADLLVLPITLMSALHPHEKLYDERFVCALWQGAPLARGRLTRERYLEAGHAVMRPQDSRGDTFHDWFVKRLGVERRVAATSYGFASVAALVVGTPHIATMHERLARHLARLYPLVIKPCPLEIPPMAQGMQWHQYRTQDPGITWLRETMREAAAQLSPG